MLDDNRRATLKGVGGMADSPTQNDPIHEGGRRGREGDGQEPAIKLASSSAGSSSTSSATSVTTARPSQSREASPDPAPFVMIPQQQQQQQPYLETISAPALRVANVTSSGNKDGWTSEASSAASNSPDLQPQKVEPFLGGAPNSNVSPRSSIPNAEDSFAAAASVPGGGASLERKRGSKKHHHRTHSDEIPRTIQASSTSFLQQRPPSPLPPPNLGLQYSPYGMYPPQQPQPPPPPPPAFLGSTSLPTSYAAAGPSPYMFVPPAAMTMHVAPGTAAAPSPPPAPQSYVMMQPNQLHPQQHVASFRPGGGGVAGAGGGGAAFPPPPARPRTYSDGGGGGGGMGGIQPSASFGFGGSYANSQESAMMSSSGAPPPRPGFLSSQQQQQQQQQVSPSSFRGEGRPLLSRQMFLSERGIGGGRSGTAGRTLPTVPNQNQPPALWSSGQPPAATHHQHHFRRPHGRSGPRGRHRKSHSSSEVFGTASSMPVGYGSFWSYNEGDGDDDEEDENDDRGGPPVVRQTRSFDPRGEFMSLTGMSRSPRAGGGGGTATSPMAGGGMGRKTFGRPGPPNAPYVVGNSIGSQASMGSQVRAAIAAGGVAAPYMVQNSIGSQASVGSQRGGNRVVWSPVVNFSAPGDLSAVPSLGSGGGGSLGGSVGAEAFLLGQSSKRYKSESVRRKHMRQHSAQLYMESIKGVEQPHRCRDVVFLLLFAFHLFGVVYLGNLYGSEAFATRSNDEQKKHSTVTVYYTPLLYLSCVSGAFAVVLSSILLAIMSIFPRNFVQVALVVVITLSFVWGTIGIGLSPKNVVPITGIIALAFSVMYAFIVWDRIPFAAANLASALSAIRSHPGAVLFAVIFQFITLLWCIYFCIVVIGVYDSIRVGKLHVSHGGAIAVYVLLVASFYWTFQVLSNTVQSVTAGVVGRWWYKRGTEHAVRHSAFRTIFYSMGSICYGSLFLGPVSVIRQVAVLFRPTVADEASLLCLHECLFCIQSCITSAVDSLVSRFNAWAFTYIGLYGYGYTDAALHATDLFQKRGWTLIVSDDLVPNVLLLSSIVLGGVAGCFAQLMEQLDSLHILSLEDPFTVAFAMGVANGLVLTSVLFSVISSSVNAVIVCFATSPVDFDQNYPQLSDEMRNAWREVWPGALDVVDIRIAMASPGGPIRPDAAEGLTSLFIPPAVASQ